MSAREEYLAGEREADVLVYLDEDAVSNPEALAEYAEPVEDGLVLVIPGDQAREALQSALGVDMMAFARRAGARDGEVAADLTDAICPDSASEIEHFPRFIFSFAEGQNPDVGGIYAEGTVIHAYVSCDCGATYSDKWVAGDR